MSPKIVLSGLTLANPYVGQGVYAMRIIQALRRIEADFAVVVPDAFAIPKELQEVHFITLPKRFAPKHALLRQALVSSQLLRFVRNEFPDAVFHSPGPIAGRVHPPKTVVTLHDCIYRSFPRYLGRFLIRGHFMRATERFAAKSSLILTDSAFSKRDLIEKLRIPADRIRLLYPWVGPEFLAPAREDAIADLRKRLQLPRRFWLYLGGYDYRKNVEFLIAAYAKARHGRSLPPLVLAGSIPKKPSGVTCDVHGALAASGLDSTSIVTPGIIPSTELPDLYRASSLLIYPSLMEGFGLPPAEALAVGTPVLASRSSSLPEVVRKSECLFDPTDIDGLVEKLVAAANDEAQFATQLPPEFTESFGIRRYCELLDDVARKNGN